MEPFLMVLQKLLSVIFVFTSVVVFHELGHFLAAKLFGVRILEFAFGMGPRLFGVRSAKTDYAVHLYPIGGYVKFAGDDADDADDPSSGAFLTERSRWQQFLVAAAGPAASVLLAFLIMFGLNMAGRTEVAFYANEPIVSAVQPEGDTSGAWFRKGDRIRAINDLETETWKDVQTAYLLSNGNGKPIRVTAERGGDVVTFEIANIPSKRLGLIAKSELEERKIVKEGPGKAFASALKYVHREITMQFVVLKAMAMGNVSPGNLSGPIGITRMTSEISSQGAATLLDFTAMISICLGIMNLLPIPILDGGRMLILSIEGIRRRNLRASTQAFLFRISFAVLIALFAFTLGNDILKWVQGRW